jgi:hypothetical protein
MLVKRETWQKRLALLAAIFPLLLTLGLPPGFVLCFGSDHVSVEASHENAHSCTRRCSRALETRNSSATSTGRCTDISFSAVTRDTLLDPAKRLSPGPTLVRLLVVDVSYPVLDAYARHRPDSSPVVDPLQRTLRVVRLLV